MERDRLVDDQFGSALHPKKLRFEDEIESYDIPVLEYLRTLLEYNIYIHILYCFFVEPCKRKLLRFTPWGGLLYFPLDQVLEVRSAALG